MQYLAAIGAADTLIGPDAAEFPFLDLATGERWVLRPGNGRVPWWLLDRARRIPGTKLRDYLGALALARAAPGKTVDDSLDTSSTLYRRFWRPLAVAALNTAPLEGSAAAVGARRSSRKPSVAAATRAGRWCPARAGCRNR